MHEGHIYYIVQLITVGLNSTYFCVKKNNISDFNLRKSVAFCT